MKIAAMITLLCVSAFGQTPAEKSPFQIGPATSSIQWEPVKTHRLVQIMTSGKELISIQDDNGDQMVKVYADGKVEYGEHYKPEASAKVFWEELAKAYLGVCTERQEKELKPATSK